MSDIGISVGLETGDAKRDSAAYIGYLKDIVDVAVKLEEKSRALNKALGATSKSLGTNAKNHTTFTTAVNKSDSSLNRLKDRLAKVQGNMDKYETVLAKAGTASTKVSTQTDRTTKGLAKQESQLKSTSAGWRLMRTAMAAIGTVALVRGLTDVTVNLEGVRAAMGSVFGASAEKEFEFIKEEAIRLGVGLTTLSKEYTSLSAAAKGTSLEGQKTRDIFLSITETSRALSLSTVDTSRALRAVNQMMSKGTVSSEELKQQLGEVLPGAFQSAARAAGVTTKELAKMLEQGQLLSDDFLPKFADQLSKDIPLSAANLQTVAATFGRLRTSAELFGDVIAKNGYAEAIKNIADEFARFLNSDEAVQVAKDIGSGFKLIGDATVTLIKNLPVIASGFASVVEAVRPMGFLLGTVADNFGLIIGAGIVGKLTGIVSSFGLMASGTAAAGVSVAGLTTALVAIAPALLVATAGVAAFVAAYKAVEAMNAFRVSISGVRAELGENALVGSVKGAVEAIKGLSAVRTTVEDVVDLANAFDDLERKTVQDSLTEATSTLGIFKTALAATQEKMAGMTTSAETQSEAYIKMYNANQGYLAEIEKTEVVIGALNALLQDVTSSEKAAKAAKELAAKYDKLTKSITPQKDRFKALEKQLLKNILVTDKDRKAIEKSIKAYKDQIKINEKNAKLKKDKGIIKALEDRIKAQVKLLNSETDGYKVRVLSNEASEDSVKYLDGLTSSTNALQEAIDRKNSAEQDGIDIAKITQDAVRATDDLADSWDNVARSMSGIFSGVITEIQELGDMEKDYTRQREENELSIAELKRKTVETGIDTGTEQLAITNAQGELDQANTIAKIGQYAEIGNAISSSFEEGSTAAKAFKVAADLAALAQAAVAIASAGTGDPYTAIPRVIAMIGLMSSIGLTLGGGGGGGSDGEYVDSGEANGKGQVLGDPDAESEAISKGLDILSKNDFAQIYELELLNKQFSRLSNLISNLATTVVRTIATGDLGLEDLGDLSSVNESNEFTADLIKKALFLDVAAGVLDTSAEIIDGVFSLFGSVGESLGGFTLQVTDFVNDLTFGLVDSFVGGVFGGDIDADVVATGLYIGNQTFDAIKQGLNASAYQTIKFEEDGGWFHSDKTWYETYYNTLNSSVTNGLQNVIMSLGNTVTDTISLLGITMENDIEDFVVSIGRIQTSGRSSDDIQAQFETIFSSMGDEMVRFLLPVIETFQEIGETLLETLTRVTAETQLVRTGLGLVGVGLTDMTEDAQTYTRIIGQNDTYYFNDTEAGFYGNPQEFSEWYESFSEFTDKVRELEPTLDLSTATQSVNYTENELLVQQTQEILEALGGTEEFSKLIEAFTTEVLKGTSVLALSTQVAERKVQDIANSMIDDTLSTAINYSDGGLNTTEFIELFDSIKDTLTAAEVIQWMEAGVAINEFNKAMSEFEDLIDSTLSPLTDVAREARDSVSDLSGELADIVQMGAGQDEDLFVSREAVNNANSSVDYKGLESNPENVEVFAALLEDYRENVERFFDEQTEAYSAARDALQEQIDLANELQDSITDVLTNIDSSIKEIVESAEGFDVAGARASELNTLFIEMLTAASLSTQEQINLIEKTEKAIIDNYDAQLKALTELQTAEMTALQESYDLRVEQEESLASLQEELADAQVTAAQALADQQNDILNEAASVAYESSLELFDLWSTAAQSLGDFLGSLDLSSLSPLNDEERLNASQQDFESTLALAQGGDGQAAADLAEVSNAYLTEAQSYFAGASDYTAIFDAVKDSIIGVEALALAFEEPQIITFGEEEIVSELELANENLADITASVIELMNAMQSGSTSEELSNEITLTEQANLDAIESLRLTTQFQLESLNLVAQSLSNVIASDLVGYEAELVALNQLEVEMTEDVISALNTIASYADDFADEVEEGMRDAFLEQSGIDSFNTDRTIDAIESYQDDAQAYYDQYFTDSAASREQMSTENAELKQEIVDLKTVMTDFFNLATGSGGGLVVQAGSEGISSL